MKGCEDEKKYGWKEECVDEKIEVIVNGKEDVRMEGRMRGWKKRCVDRWEDVWMG